MDKLPLSIVLIAKNEAHNLPVCLGAVSPWCAEIIAVINDCTDETEAILKSYGAKVWMHPYKNQRDQKNVALSHASEPWVLSLDADEEVTPALYREIKDFIEREDPAIQGASIPRKTWFLGRWIKHGDWYPDFVSRLCRNGKGKFVGSPVHDRLEIEGKAVRLKHDLLHYSFPTINSMLGKYPFFGKFFIEEKLGKNKKFHVYETIFRSFWRFFRGYFLRLGFLDGYPGFFIAFNQSFNTIYRWSLLLEHRQKEVRARPERCDL